MEIKLISIPPISKPCLRDSRLFVLSPRTILVSFTFTSSVHCRLAFAPHNNVIMTRSFLFLVLMACKKFGMILAKKWDPLHASNSCPSSSFRGFQVFPKLSSIIRHNKPTKKYLSTVRISKSCDTLTNSYMTWIDCLHIFPSFLPNCGMSLH